MTKKLLKRTVTAGAMAAGILLALGTSAQAWGLDADTTGNNGIGNGNQVIAPIQAPVDVCGNAVGALVGVAGAGCTGGSDASMNESVLGDMTSAGNNGILNGNQVQAPIQVPINVCGNAVAVAGVAGAGCTGGSDASLGGGSTESAPAEFGLPGVADVAPAGGKVGQTVASTTKQLPAGDTVTGLASGLPTSGLTDTARQQVSDTESFVTEGAKCSLGDMTSAGNHGIANGNQVQAPIQVPVDVSGNAVAVLGLAGAGSTGGSSASLC